MNNQLDRIYERLKRDHQSRGWEIDESRLRSQAWMLNDRMVFESTSNTSSSSSGGSGGGNPTLEWISVVNTSWIYPQVDLENCVLNITNNNLIGTMSWGMTYSSINFTRPRSNKFVFPTIGDAINFYSEMFFQSAVSQPFGNVGYSLGVGTILRSRRNPRLTFELESGVKIIEFVLMKQITPQSQLQSGGNSPDGSIGWGSIYVDWNADGVPDLTSDLTPSVYVDPLRFQVNS